MPSDTLTVRMPAVAGQFYPATRPALEQAIEDCFEATVPLTFEPKAIIVPHAGFVYSGPIAASVYALPDAVRKRIRRVVLLGPAHRVYVQGLALTSATGYQTPLGTVPLDREAADSIAQMPQVCVSDEAHAPEHSLEVQLPFLQTVLDDFTLLPLVVGESSPSDVAAVIEALWGGDETLIVISTDLSHFHDYESAHAIDTATGQAVTALNYEVIGPEQACGCAPLNGLLYLARQRGLESRLIDLRNSGDTAGPRNRVVGYGAFTVTEPEH